MNNKAPLQYEEIFRTEAQLVLCYPNEAKTKSANYDKFRDVGYTVQQMNPFPVKAIINQVSPYSESLKEVGLISTAAKDLIIREKDKSIIENCGKIEIGDDIFSAYSDALGNKMQVSRVCEGYYKVRVFIKVK